ncbi:O-methyltransferase [Winogradskyella eximia]|mgnify:FL=1|jgi:Dimerisation2-like domain/O-methyltransferase domain|uniref:O-methyltransferase n=1 Tax=Winogradskyella eximia TaxID=262006 RepID=A0A3D9H0V7_9FLAO|nr:methyltransferase [Winogradskyella eximia]RED43148.1 O-methyltransferase [Winogradskyella eximia]|tara:strand:- start:18329 stop:19390 length:1062 start_codon:yes stop_codon:yes gene_type:complete
MENTSLRAIDAIQEAQKIAFAPFVFQATVSLRKLGVFSLIFDRRKKGGITIEELSKELSISVYGLGVLLEIAESSEIVSKDDSGNFELTTTGYFLNYNETVNVNINFTNEVCYKGLFHLNDAIKTGKPEGLKELGNWDTVYEGLSQLTPEVKKSWFEFDHHYSDAIFNDALEIVFRTNPKTIFDIGGNTGKFAISSCKYNEDVSIKIIDLPGQLNVALNNVKNEGFEKRVSGYEIDWLKDNPSIPTGADTIWMCQFLDCFSEEEILKILSTCVKSMDDNTELLIMETFTDRQRFDNAKFVLEATSLYFTVMANGNSKMYPAEVFLKLIDKAGLVLEEDINVGEYHTILVCKKK